MKKATVGFPTLSPHYLLQNFGKVQEDGVRYRFHTVAGKVPGCAELGNLGFAVNRHCTHVEIVCVSGYIDNKIVCAPDCYNSFRWLWYLVKSFVDHSETVIDHATDQSRFHVGFFLFLGANPDRKLLAGKRDANYLALFVVF